jgi:hypothetical protein
MLRSLKDLEGYQVSATDGELGSVANFLLDDLSWTTRYLVVETGSYFDQREVLISPIFFRRIDWAGHLFHLALTRDRIRQSPGADTDLPVSRQHERDYFRYFGYPNYWGSTGVWGMNAAPVDMIPFNPEIGPGPEFDEPGDDRHLRSAKYVRGYHVHGSDEEIGHIEDFIVDDETWQIRYLVINTSNWWVGKNVLVPPFWATRVSWDENMVYLGLSREEIRNCPEWNADAAVNRAYEERLFDYYGRPVYWERPVPVEPK